MSPSAAHHKRRRVLVEVSPSWSEKVRLWLHKLRHPRQRWFSGRLFFRARKTVPSRRRT